MVFSKICQQLPRQIPLSAACSFGISAGVNYLLKQDKGNALKFGALAAMATLIDALFRSAMSNATDIKETDSPLHGPWYRNSAVISNSALLVFVVLAPFISDTSRIRELLKSGLNTGHPIIDKFFLFYGVILSALTHHLRQSYNNDRLDSARVYTLF